jgi:hypothetical protein
MARQATPCVRTYARRPRPGSEYLAGTNTVGHARRLRPHTAPTFGRPRRGPTASASARADGLASSCRRVPEASVALTRLSLRSCRLGEHAIQSLCDALKAGVPVRTMVHPQCSHRVL